MNPPGEIVTCHPSQDDLGRNYAFGQTENELPIVEDEYQVTLSNPGETPSGKFKCRVLVKCCITSIIDS